MIKNRFFINSPLQPGAEIKVPKEELGHFKVLRVHPGEKIEIVNGQGEVATATYLENKSVAIQEVDKEAPPQHESILLLALTESAHLDFTIEKGCEIGVTHFVLFPSSKSRKQSLSENKVVRLNKLLISALKQSRRLHLPKLTILKSLNDLKDLPSNLYLADPTGAPLAHTPNASCGFLVGPESGFTNDEIDHFTEELGAKKISLSRNVLRTETASMVCAFLLIQKHD